APDDAFQFNTTVEPLTLATRPDGAGGGGEIASARILPAGHGAGTGMAQPEFTPPAKIEPPAAELARHFHSWMFSVGCARRRTEARHTRKLNSIAIRRSMTALMQTP